MNSEQKLHQFKTVLFSVAQKKELIRKTTILKITRQSNDRFSFLQKREEKIISFSMSLSHHSVCMCEYVWLVLSLTFYSLQMTQCKIDSLFFSLSRPIIR